MHISFFTPTSNFTTSTGYGYASFNIIESLKKLGHDVSFANSKAPVQINFCQPYQNKMHRNQYQISYTPWESTSIPENWYEMAKISDEIWTTSDWNAQIFKENKLSDEVHVYPHGITDVWTPKRRKPSGIIRFLHIGEPAPRKAGQMTVDAFIELFGNNPNYHLTIKAYKSSTVRIYNNKEDRNIIGLPEQMYSNITLITDDMEENDLVKLYHDHDVLIYPSYGEGFGFIPLQALATGMPTICTDGWAHYKKFLGPLALKSKLIDSPWHNHTGKVLEPNYEHLLELMKDVAENFNAYSGYYFSQSTKIHEEYNWLQLTNNAFDHIFKKFQ